MEEIIVSFFKDYAYSPGLVYLGICGFMLLSAFGLPLPEEIILVSAGLVGYVSLHPDKFPPPTPDAVGVNPYTLATVAFIAVIFSDTLIYFLGRYFGPSVMKVWPLSKVFTAKNVDKIGHWTKKYGLFAVFFLRFTPGLRFPGHLMCGAMGMSIWGFLAVDIVAAGVSVPTQVLLVSFYGEYIIQYMQQFKFVLFGILALVIAYFLFKKFVLDRKQTPA